MIASRNLDRASRVTIDGATIGWNDRDDGWNSGDVLRFENVGADTLGNLAVYFDIRGTSGATNALRILVVPEPGTTGLLLFGALLLLVTRLSRVGR